MHPILNLDRDIMQVLKFLKYIFKSLNILIDT
jgi:hypothetical protein